MSEEAVIIKKKATDKEFKEPNKYKVIVCNDDVTPVDFVVAMMMAVFKHDQNKAVEITMEVHHKGSAVAGVYSYEIAEQKGLDATNMARDNGFPLVIKIEAE